MSRQKAKTMTTHELARKLLEGPDARVTIQGHEPYEDCFDEITRADIGVAWRVDHVGKGFSEDLYDAPPRNPNLKRESIAIVVLR